jgi:hypothetical protein
VTADDTFLTDAEVERLVGTPRKGRQIAWLSERGYPLEVNEACRPVVLRSVVLARLGGKVENRRKRPNFGAINGQASN